MLALGVAFAYVELGTEAVALLGVLVLVFQYLVGALLVSQERADELELRARQLAGFQVALLSALLRTLDLRDRMTARHSAAVARYSREIAAQAGLSERRAGAGPLRRPAARHRQVRAPRHDPQVGPAQAPRRRVGGDQASTPTRARGSSPRSTATSRSARSSSPTTSASTARATRAGSRGEEIPELARIISVADTYDVMTARDTYREPVSSYEAVIELRRVSGTQLDARFVEAFVKVLDGKDLAYRHGEDADFEAELALDKRIHDYVAATPGATRASAARFLAGPNSDKRNAATPSRRWRTRRRSTLAAEICGSALAIAHDRPSPSNSPPICSGTLKSYAELYTT